MASKALIKKNLKYKKLARLNSKRILELKKDTSLEALRRLQKLGRKSSRTRVSRRCPLTGRARGVYRFCGLSRGKIREYYNLGLLPGIMKSSW